MEYVDFKKTKSTIVYQLLHSSDSVPKDNSLLLFDYFKFLHFFRHNYLHFLVLKSIGMEWKEETQLKELFHIDLPDEYALKSPDIVLERDGKIYLIDVSIAYDIHQNGERKQKNINK